jgi:hypothetical protein
VSTAADKSTLYGFNFTVVNTEIFYYVNTNCYVTGGTF